MSELNVDTINEQTSANGVTIDGVKLKDNVVLTDTISEKTSAAGVTIDGVLIKDGNVDGVDVSKTGLIHISTTTVASGSAASTLDVQSVFSSTYTDYKVITNLYGSNTSDTRCYFKFMSGSSANSDTYSYTMYHQRLSTDATGQESGQGTGGAYFGYLRPRYDVDNSNGGKNHAIALISDPYGTATYPSVSFQTMFTRSAGSYAAWGYEGHAALLSTSSLDGIQFFGASGNIYGTVKVYGYGE